MNRASQYLLLICSLVSVCARGIEVDMHEVDKGARPGVWTTDLEAARQYAKANNTFYLILFVQDGCGICAGMEYNIFSKDDWKNWSISNNIPIVLANYTRRNYASTQALSLYGGFQSTPTITVVDGRDGTSRFGFAYLMTGIVQTGDGTAIKAPKYGYYEATEVFGEKTVILDLINFFFSYIDDVPYNNGKKLTTKGNQLNATAREISPDKAETDKGKLKVWTIWDNYNVDFNLNATNFYFQGTRHQSYIDNSRNWCVFTNGVAGASYRLAGRVVDPKNLGRVFIYDSLENAQAGNESLAKAEQKAIQWAPMTDLNNDNGFVFTVPSTGPVYIEFTRRPAGDKEDIDISYTFTLQEANAMEFWFDKQVWTGYEGETNKIAVVRSSEVGNASVGFTIVGKDAVSSVTSVNPSNYDQAIEGATNDYYIINAEGTANTDCKVDFADGVLTNYIYVVNNRGEEDVHSRDRAFGLKLDSEVSEDGRYVEAFIAVEDADAEKKDTDGACVAKSELLELKGFLNKDDEQDIYTLTNVSAKVGSIYGFSVDFNMAKDFQAGKIYVKAVRTGSGQCIASRAGRSAQTLADGRVEVGVGGYAFFLFGSESETGGDVEITVSRDAAANGEFPTVRYGLNWRRFDRPVVAFETNDEIMIPRDGTNKVYSLSLVADTIAPITNYVQEAFALDVGWCTTNGTDAAVADVDYAVVAPTSCTFTTDNASVSVEVLSRDALLYPELTFKAMLLDDTKDYMYKVDETRRDVTFRFAADSVVPGASVVLDASAAGWQTTGDEVRALNYTNVVDWIKVENVVSSDAHAGQGTFYRLRATDLMVKPASEDDCLTVDVCTNKADNAIALYSYRLKDLVFDDPAEAPVVCFDAVGDDNAVWLRVSREQDDSVLAEYKLSLREWKKPVFRFAETSVETNDTVATFNLTLLREGNVSDEVTVKVVSSNETVAAGNEYFIVPETVTFAAEAEQATLQVTIADPEWNAFAWTGDRVFSLSLDEVHPVGAFDFSETSNTTTVVLKETNGTGLDEADGFDETREDVTTNDVAVAIASDGTLTNLVRTLNGCAADGYVNDINDWFRFSDIVAGETYCFKAIDCFASNAEVKAEFFIGDSAEATKSLTLDELKEGYRYTAEANADVFVKIYRDPSDKVASVNYELVAYKYIWPTVGFDVDADTIVVTNTPGKGNSILIDVFRKFNTNETIDVTFELKADGWAANYFTGVYPPSMAFAPTEAISTNVEVSLAGRTEDVWRGDWDFTLTLSADPGKVRFGPTNITVRVVDGVSQKDPSDPDDDAQDGAAVLAFAANTDSLVATNHLNGVDDGSHGYTDTNDWFKITGVAPGNYYRVSVPLRDSEDNLDLELSVVSDALATNVVFAAESAFIDVPATNANDILVCVARSASDGGRPVSLRYELCVEKIAWPVFDMSVESPVVANDCGATYAVVTRTGNADHADSVIVDVVDTNVVKVTQNFTPQTVMFMPGETVAKTVAVAVVSSEEGFWKRGGDFVVALMRAEESPSVTLADSSSATVTVVDASGIPENDYPSDDQVEGAQEYAFAKIKTCATNHVAEGQAVVWLNGNDTNDWYYVTGTASGRRYRLWMDEVAANLEGLASSVTTYDSQMNILGVTNIVDGARWDIVAPDDGGIYVCVARGTDAGKDISVRYVLSFREMDAVSVGFETADISVSEAAAAVYVNVVCATENGESLERDAVVTVTPVEDETAAWPAKADFDFVATPITISWPEGSTGGVQRVRVPLVNHDDIWEGDETFKLVLAAAEAETGIGHLDTMTVTLTDKDPPMYGTVGITGYGETTVCEGGTFPVEFTRINGDAGAVTGKFTWVVGKGKGQEQLIVLFDEREQGTKTVTLEVPKNTTFALSQSATLTFALAAAKGTVALTKGAVTKIALTVTAANYGGNVSAYSADDAAKPMFRAATTAWYAGAGGDSLVAATPKAGATSVMSVTLTAPCRLVFDAAFANAVNCELAVMSGASTLATITESTVDAEVAIDGHGAKTVQFVFKRGKTGTSDLANVEVSNVRVIRSDDVNRTGTYTGLAEIDGVSGYATMSVAANGTFSCKVTCADRVWTVSGRNPWADGATFAAKSAGMSKTVAFGLVAASGTVELRAVEGDVLLARLSRNGWGDKPLSAAAATAIEKCAGYYTVAYAPTDGTCGSGYMGVTISKNGAVRASGVLADGTAVAISSTLVLGAEGRVTIPLFSKPLAYNGGWFCDTLSVVEGAGGVMTVTSDGGSRWLCLEKGGIERFDRAPSAAGGWYDKAENLYNAYSSGLAADVEDRVIALSFSENGAKLSVDSYDGLFTISFARATGLFSGFVREYVETSGRQIRKSYPYKGMFTPNAPEGAAAGRGFYLKDGESKDVKIAK